MKHIRAGVVGLGIGMAHVAGYLQSPGARLLAVADAWPERRDHVGGTFGQGSMPGLKPLFDEPVLMQSWEDLGIRVYDDVQGIIEDPEIDLVSLCTPDDTHEEFAVKLLAAGKNLLLEKPVALTLESARRIASAAEQNGCRIAVGYEMRVNPAIARVRSLVTEGAVGDVQAFNLQQHRTPFRRDKWQKWIQDKARSGGLIVEETCHWFDLARYLTGKEIRQLSCVGNGRVIPDFDYEDIAFIQGSYDDGSIFQIGHSLTGFDFSLTIQVHGTAGTIWCGMKAAPRTLLDGGESQSIAVVAWGPVDAPGDGQFVTYGADALEGASIRDNVMQTVEALRRGAPFAAEFDDGYRSLEIALAARRALESGTKESVR